MSIISQLEALLFISGKEGISINEIKRVIDLTADEIRDNIKILDKKYLADPDCSLTIKIYDAKIYLLTKSEYAELFTRLFDETITNDLTEAQLEVLSIIAYNDPCPSTLISKIRNNDSANVIDRLVKLQLIENVGRASSQGAPYLYSVTSRFMNLFGLKTLSNLPIIGAINEDELDVGLFDFNREDNQ
jgi:segregation and condensation protein B